MLDPGSLAVLGSHFDRLMSAISSKVDSVRTSFYSNPELVYNFSRLTSLMKCFS